jgi:GT2 family glycosyltransferase
LAALVDAYSSDGFNIIVYTSDENLGYGSGNNLAAEILLQKHLDLIWVLNPDTHVTGKAASLLREIAASSADIFSTRTIEDNVSSNGSSTISTLTGKTSRPRQQTFEQRLWSFDYPSGHSIIFKRDAWLKLNGFNDRYFLFMEEADLTLRAHALNLKIAALSEVTVQHNQGLTTGSSKDILSKSNVAFRESTKSRIIFFREHFLSRLPLLLLTRIAYAAYVYARGNKPGARAIVDGLMTGIGITVKK